MYKVVSDTEQGFSLGSMHGLVGGRSFKSTSKVQLATSKKYHNIRLRGPLCRKGPRSICTVYIPNSLLNGRVI